MRLTILCLLTTVMLLNCTPIVQNDTPTATHGAFQFTATQLIVGATQTALIRNRGTPRTPALGQAEFDSSQLTATRMVSNATQTAAVSLSQTPIVAQSTSENALASSPLGLTLFIFGTLILTLIIIGGGFLLLNARQNDKQRRS